MNYFRYILVASVLTFSTTPLQAADSPYSFLKSCYGFTSWISSSLFATKEFVKSEIRELRAQLKKIRGLISIDKQELSKVNEDLTIARTDLADNIIELTNIRTKHQEDSAAVTTKFETIDSIQQEIVLGLHAVNEKSVTLNQNAIDIDVKLIAIAKSNEDQRKKTAEDKVQLQKQLEDRYKNNLNRVREHFPYNELAAIKALVKADDERFDCISKRLDKIEQQRESFTKYSEDIERKINALHTDIVIKKSVLAQNATTMSQSALLYSYKKAPEIRKGPFVGLTDEQPSNETQAPRIDYID